MYIVESSSAWKLWFPQPLLLIGSIGLKSASLALAHG